MSTTTAYRFTRAFDEPGEVQLDDVGGKGFGLIEMTKAGLRVPPGFVISTAACHRYLAVGSVPDDLANELDTRLGAIEQATEKTFGAGPMPLLLSVRSGAPVSMPGMMDTVLNLGLNRDAAVALAEATGSPEFMADVVFRFHCMYAETVLGAFEVPERDEFIELIGSLPEGTEPAQVYDAVWSFCAERLADECDETVPTDPRDQLIGAVEAVFRSWNTRRATTYRELHGIAHDMGTAVVVQAMVFGNLDSNSGSGVVFTRNPVTGEPGMFGEYLEASQGEDVVSGTFTPDPVEKMAENAPEAYRDLVQTCEDLERLRSDMLDIEFTVERGKLYMLQFRSAKRTARAAIRIAADMRDEGILDDAAALASVSLSHIRDVQRPGFDPAQLSDARASDRVITVGVGASPGQVVGTLAFDSDAAEDAAKAGTPVILARPVTSPTDLHGMIAAKGIVTTTGGSTSHAAVVARALGTTCIVGCAELEIDPDAGVMSVGDQQWRAGDTVSLDGSTGEVIAGSLDLIDGASGQGDGLDRLLSLTAKSTADLAVLARAQTATQVSDIFSRGATGLVTAVDDLLVTSGHFSAIVDSLEQGNDLSSVAIELENAVAEAFAPLLSHPEVTAIDIRGLDFHSDDVAELLSGAGLFALHPQIAMPLGAPELVSAQLRGLVRASSGKQIDVCFVSPRTSSVAEAVALRKIRDELDVPVKVGCYVTNSQGLLNLPEMVVQVDRVWLELHRLQAETYGIPTRHLLAAEPLDSYVRDELIDIDPRTQIGHYVEQLLDQVVRRLDSPDDLWVRLSGEVSEQTMKTLRAKGFRQFAVAIDEIRPAKLAAAR